MATSARCQYITAYGSKCGEPTKDTGRKFCIFHDINYLKGDDNYEKNKEEVAEEFKKRLSKYSSNNMPLIFIGYCLPDISFENEKFTETVYFDYATFYGEANFSNATFSELADFNLAKFSKEADFTGAKFSEKADFGSATFSEKADFGSATFSNVTYFSRTKFSEKAYFSNAKFSEKAYFFRARFSKRADFNRVKFCGEKAIFRSAEFSGQTNFNNTRFVEADFYSARFSEKADFVLAKFFGKIADFMSTKFSGEAIFWEANFFGVANFFHANFSEAGFREAKFCGKADFRSAEFSGKANFSEVEFHREARFPNAKFHGEANFESSDFSNEAHFNEVTFSKQANFAKSRFDKLAEFKKVRFVDQANFAEANFFNGGQFTEVTFSKEADFIYATFLNFADFSHVKFLNEVRFSEATESKIFNGETLFKHTIFEQPNKALFDINDLSKVSFAGSDVSKVTFTDKVRWGGDDSLKVIEEEMLENFLKYSFDFENITAPNSKDSDRLKDFLRQRGINWKGDLQFTKIDNAIFVTSTLNSLFVYDDSSPAAQQIDDKGSYVFAKNQKKVSSMHIKLYDNSKKAILSIDGNESYKFVVKEDKDKLKVYPNEELSLDLVLYVYRRLRENYEFKLKFDEAGKFFIKEMELKRKYRNVRTKTSHNFEVKMNCWFRRNLSLTGLYYHFSNYGESIVKPTIIGAITVGLSTLFWLIQNNPTIAPSLSFIAKNSSHMSNITSNFINLTQIWNNTHTLKAFERSFADFLPLLSLPGEGKVGIIDYVIKIVGGALTFGLLIIALRRKFERKYTR